MALIILAHPVSAESIANKTIIESLEQSDLELEVRDIGQLYSDHKINVVDEQEALLRHNIVILQHPLYWYNIPSILKSWMDQILTYQFAYGSNGDKLKNKKLLQSVTVGQLEKDMEVSIHSLSSLVQAIAKYSQMDFIGTFPLYDIATLTGNTPASIQEKANIHSQKLYDTIKSIQ